MADLSPSDELLMKYLDGDMSSAEKESFESAMAADATLFDRVDALRTAKQAVQYYGLNTRVGDVRKEWEAENLAQPQGAKVIPMLSALRNRIAVAASIILIIVGVKMIWFSAPSADKIYADTFVSYQIGNTRSTENNVTSLDSAWRMNNYDEVIRISKTNSWNVKAQLLAAISHLQKNEPNMAIPLLEEVQKNPDQTYHQDSEFYLALAYLKNKEYEKSLELLRKIHSNDAHLYHSQVNEETIREVEKLK